MAISDELSSCLACNSRRIGDFIQTKSMMHSQDSSWNFQQCIDCKLVFLNPRVAQESLSKYYTDSYLPYRGPDAWGKYSSLVKWDLSKIDKARLKTIQRYANKRSEVLLDVGCGKPSFLQSVSDKTNYKCIGIDFSDSGWSDNRSEYKDIDLIVGEPSDIPERIKADLITMWHYLEHDFTPQSTLRSLLNNAHPNTKLIIEVPNHDSYSRRKYQNYWAGYHTPRHTGLYNIDNMTELLYNSGWEVVDSYTRGTLDPYTLDWMSRMEKDEIDWTMSMESYFTSFVIGKMKRPIYYFDRIFSLGFMTVIAEPIS